MRRWGAWLVLAMVAAPPAVAQSEGEFASACLSVGASAEVCTCKAAAAGKLLDERMRGLVMLSMTEPQAFTAKAQRGELTDQDQITWNIYIQESNRSCGLNY